MVKIAGSKMTKLRFFLKSTHTSLENCYGDQRIYFAGYNPGNPVPIMVRSGLYQILKGWFTMVKISWFQNDKIIRFFLNLPILRSIIDKATSTSLM